MAAVVAGPFLGGLVGGAVYYTISQTISNRTSYIRSELHDCAQALSYHSEPSSSFTKFPIPASSQPYLTSQPLSDLLRARWNAVVERAVTGFETTDWGNVAAGVWNAGSGVVDRVASGVHGPADSSTGSSVGSIFSGLGAGTASRGVLSRDIEKEAEKQNSPNTDEVGRGRIV